LFLAKEVGNDAMDCHEGDKGDDDIDFHKSSLPLMNPRCSTYYPTQQKKNQQLWRAAVNVRVVKELLF